MPNNTWTFTQINTGDAKPAIELNDLAAPHGRPRIHEVVAPGKRLRQNRVRYPGNSGAPTTHLFGTDHKDFELTGRWSDRKLGKGAAASYVNRFNTLLDDQKLLRISWGELLSYQGFLASVDIKWEALNECVWRLSFLIDRDELADLPPQTIQPAISPTQLADDLEAWMAEVSTPFPKQLPNLDAVTGEVFDQLDDMVASVTQYGGLAVKAANAVSNWESAGFAELSRLQAGLHQFKTAVLTLQSTIENMSIDSLVIDRTAEDDIAWLTFQTLSEKRTNAVLSSATLGIQEAAKAVARGIKTTYTALDGDTWESISTKFYGSPEGADKIRQANGVKGGEKPQAERTYTIPHS